MHHFGKSVGNAVVVVSRYFGSGEVGGYESAELHVITVGQYVGSRHNEVAVMHGFTRFSPKVVNSEYRGVERLAVAVGEFLGFPGGVVMSLSERDELSGRYDHEVVLGAAIWFVGTQESDEIAQGMEYCGLSVSGAATDEQSKSGVGGCEPCGDVANASQV